MRIIDLYSCSLFISKKNSTYTMEQLDKEPGKGLGLAYEYTYSGYEQLQKALATTIELLSYSNKARDLISKETWGECILRDLSSEDSCIPEIEKMSAKQTHGWDVESRPLKFLLVIFFSYNTLYTWDRGKTDYNYTCLLKDFKEIMITEHTGKVVKTKSKYQAVDNIISDFCFYSILKGTVNEFESNKNLIEVIEYMETALRYFHQFFMNWGDIISSEELEIQFDTLRKNNYNRDKKKYKDYLNLNLEMKHLSKKDIELLDSVVEELFSFQPDDNFEKRIKEESEKLDVSFEQRKNVDIKPLDFMKQIVRGDDKKKVLEIINQFSLQ